GPALPKEIITEYFKEYKNEVKKLHIYGIVVDELNIAGHQIFKIRLEEIEGNIVVDILADKQKLLNVEEFLIDLEKFFSNSESSSEDDTPNLSDLLYSVHSFIDTFNNNLVEAVKSRKTLCIDESMNTWLVLADSSTNIIIQLEPYEDKEIKKKQFVADYGSTAAYILWLAHPWFGNGRTIVGNSWFGLPKLCILLIKNRLYSIFYIKKRCGWSLNYSWNVIQKLKTTYGSFISKVATINDIYLIAASLRDRKLQCIIATASTTANEEEVI
ncbi:42898_t:CDS:2, partial [Gigaspora margarita]